MVDLTTRARAMGKRKRPVTPAMKADHWRRASDPQKMAQLLRRTPRASSRVMRLFLAAFWHWQSFRLRDTTSQERLRHRAALVAQWAETDKRPPETGQASESSFVGFNDDAFRALVSTTSAPTNWGQSGKVATEAQVPLLREIFGNPHRPIDCEPSWLTSTVVALATGIYDEQAFDRMPILADALQDAGCDNEDILSHCRDESLTHVRGCWVVDLLLNKA